MQELIANLWAIQYTLNIDKLKINHHTDNQFFFLQYIFIMNTSIE